VARTTSRSGTRMRSVRPSARSSSRHSAAIAGSSVVRSIGSAPTDRAALAASLIAGAIWASIASAMRLWRNAPEVLTTILLNFIAIHVLGYAVNGPLQEASGKYPQSDAIPMNAMLPMIGDLHAGIIIAVLAAIGAWFLLYRTAEGLRLRASGFNRSAAKWAGINVNAQVVRAMAISGSMAGLAGGIELLGVTHRLFERFAAGYGYAGIAVALLAQLHPLGTLASAFFFGALTTGAGELQRTAGISSTVATFGQAIVILVMIVFTRRSRERGRPARRPWKDHARWRAGRPRSQDNALE